MTAKHIQSDGTDDLDETIRAVGYDCLGPIMHRWLLALDQYVSFFDDGESSFLYVARAGVRIKRLYASYLEGIGRTIGSNHEMLWISRLAACKGTYGAAPGRAAETISREYYHHPLRKLVRGIWRNDPDYLASIEGQLSDKVFDAHGFNFPGWLKTRHPIAGHMRNYFAESSAAFENHLDTLLGGNKRAVLIDSGWQGTAQSMLHHAFPDVEWQGLYIGRILTPQSDNAIQDKVIGLLFQAETYDPDRPETAITLHRHVFETLLEPNGPSIEETIGGPNDKVAQAQIAENLNETVDPDHDRLFLLVEEYLRDNAGLGPAEIMARSQGAMVELARLFSRPTRTEALAVQCKDRSADFGKSLDVPVLIDPDEANTLSTSDPDQRINQSLWPQGQIALEYTGEFRKSLQERVSGLEDNASYFDPSADETEADEGATNSADIPAEPVVAVVTRTKNRPILLERAAESVANQTYGSYIWVVVNDGGDEDLVRGVIDNCTVDRRKIQLVSNASSLGMEAASNAGIRSVQSDYVLIHDDDDALHSEFLERTVKFLESEKGQRYDGVVTGAEYVSEEIRGDKVIIHNRVPYMDWVSNIQLTELFAQNLFAPISFLYRRKVYDEIGGYNEELPVLGDWFFNLEFVLKSDIKVLRDKLAYYHHRDHGDSSRSGIYANSVIGGQSKHEEFASVFRNMFMRKHANTNPLAAAAVSSYFASQIRGKLDHMAAALGQTTTPGSTKVEGGQFVNEFDRIWTFAHVRQGGKLLRRMIRPGRRAHLDNATPIGELVSIARDLGITVPIPPNFDETAYLRENPDVRGAVDGGAVPSGYMHYLANGQIEGRNRPIRT